MKLDNIAAEAIGDNPDVLISKDGLEYQVAEVYSRAGVLIVVCASIPNMKGTKMVPLTVWCRETKVDPRVARNAAREGRIPEAIKVGSEKRGDWMIPRDCQWRPNASGGRQMSENPSRSALSHRKRRAKQGKESP